MRIPCSSSPVTLGVIRSLIFGFFFVQAARTSVWSIGYLPVTIMRPPGVMEYLSWKFYDRLITPTGMTLLQGALLVALGTAAIGAFTRLTTKAAVALVLLYQGVLRSFGHFNHDEMVAMICMVILAASPCGDRFSLDACLVRRPAPDSYAYGYPILLMQACLAWAYATCGALKLVIGGREYFSKDSLPILCIRHSLGNLLDTQFQFGLFLPQVRNIVPLAVAIAVIWELSFPLAIILPRAKWVWLAFGIIFHTSTMLLMNITFPCQILAYVAFVDWGRLISVATTSGPEN